MSTPPVPPSLPVQSPPSAPVGPMAGLRAETTQGELPRFSMTELVKSGVALLRLSLLLIGGAALSLVVGALISDVMLAIPSRSTAQLPGGPSPERLQAAAEAFAAAAEGGAWQPDATPETAQLLRDVCRPATS